MSLSKWLGAALGIAAAAGCSKSTPTAPSGDEVIYSALGASDGMGVGGSVPCVPYDPECPGGTGYVYLLKRRFQSDGRDVTLLNRSNPGAVLSAAMQTLARDVGRDIPVNFLDQGVPFIAANSTHVTLFTGGNDANVIGQNVRAGRGGSDPRGFIDQQVNQFGTDLNELIRRLRARAPNARLVAYNLPNLGVAPYVAGNTAAERSAMQRIAVAITDRINALASQNVLVIDLMCEPRLYDATRFSSDGFHPSDAGYALMAELGYPALTNGTAAAPSPTCAQRSLLPAF